MLPAPSGYGHVVDVVELFAALMDTTDPTMIVVTTAAGGERAGCLVGFSTQCSIDPSRYVVFLSNKNRTFRVASQGADMFVVHFLDRSDEVQDAIAELFGGETGDDIDKFERCRWRPYGDVPVLDGCPRWFAGRIVNRFEPGDHAGFVLEPLTVVVGDEPDHELGYQDAKSIDAGHDA
jgi:flavin reductase (DIM6/NTAB) family NADH-FMN oxidoreductase RutF